MDVHEQLCYTDAYARRVDGRVVSIDDTGEATLIVLDRKSVV